MAAYLIGQIIIHDMEKFMPYVANTPQGIVFSQDTSDVMHFL